MRPSDCALLVTVPLHRPEFMADLAAGTDFLERFVASQRSRDLDVLWATYDASAATAAASIERARRHGVTVTTRAGLADFARCVETFQVVTLVAHWRNPLFRAAEIRDVRAVRRVLAGGGVVSGRGCADAADAAASLNHLLQAEVTLVEQLDGGQCHDTPCDTRRQYVLWNARRELQSRLGAAVRPGGPAVEFAEGSVPLERVVSAVPETFEGVLDLTVCNSTLLAEEIRRRCRRGLLITNAFPATLDIRMEFYNAAMDLVQRRQVSYQDAVFGVHHEIRGQL